MEAKDFANIAIGQLEHRIEELLEENTKLQAKIEQQQKDYNNLEERYNDHTAEWFGANKKLQAENKRLKEALPKEYDRGWNDAIDKAVKVIQKT